VLCSGLARIWCESEQEAQMQSPFGVTNRAAIQKKYSAKVRVPYRSSYRLYVF